MQLAIKTMNHAVLLGRDRRIFQLGNMLTPNKTETDVTCTVRDSGTDEWVIGNNVIQSG